MEEYKEYTICKDAQEMLKKADKDGVETVWDRHKKQQPHCGYCELGLSCRICTMGPCRIDPFGEGPQKGVCGADADIMVARNLARMVAAGSASHSDHGRDLVEVLYKIGAGKTTSYTIKDDKKLKSIAKEYGLDIDGKDEKNIAKELALAMMEDYGMKKDRINFITRAPKKRLELWEKLRVIPRGIDRETTEMLHRTHMGVDNDYVSILLQAVRTSLSDGFGGSMIGTEVSDIIFGTPSPAISSVNLGVLKEDMINILVHGHNPVVSEMVYLAVNDPKMKKKKKQKG